MKFRDSPFFPNQDLGTVFFSLSNKLPILILLEQQKSGFEKRPQIPARNIPNSRFYNGLNFFVSLYLPYSFGI
jgi:hypothetical protein